MLNARAVTGLVARDDPRADDVRALLGRHRAFADRHSPPEDVHALNLDDLLDPAVAFFSCRGDGVLLGVGALRHLAADHGEVKSMHTAAESRGRGVGRAVLDHIVAVARDRGYRRLSLETGTMAAFAPARAMYLAAAFTRCAPFGDYAESPNSMFFTRVL